MMISRKADNFNTSELKKARVRGKNVTPTL
jgi:hypothetical protein